MSATHTLVRTATAALLACVALGANAQATGPIKVGLMLPYSGTYASLGNMIESGFKLYVQEQGGKLGGREIQYFKVDDESEPSKATDNVNKLIKRDQVEVLVGTVHSGVALAMAKAAKDSKTLLIIPNAGADAITGAMCAPNIVRSSFSNWQPGYAMGVVAGQKGVKRAMTLTWNYAAGAESVKGFTQGLEKGGGKVIKDLNLPFPNVEFQALLTEIAAQKPDAVYSFFAGGGAVKFVKDYAAAGLKAVNGDLTKREALTTAMHKTVVDSPRGKFSISPAGNPVQDMYLREVKGNNNEFRSIAVKALADPATGCSM